jgi:hypothetical protein
MVMTARAVSRQETGASSSGLSVSLTLYLGLNVALNPVLYSALTAILRLCFAVRYQFQGSHVPVV